MCLSWWDVLRVTRARDPGWHDRLPVQSRLGMRTASAVKFRRRCDTYTNFDSNRAY